MIYSLKTMSQWWNQRRNQKTHGYKWKWKHNITKFMGCSKSSSNQEFIVIQDFFRKQDKSQIISLTYQIIPNSLTYQITK